METIIDNSEMFACEGDNGICRQGRDFVLFSFLGVDTSASFHIERTKE